MTNSKNNAFTMAMQRDSPDSLGKYLHMKQFKIAYYLWKSRRPLRLNP